jgi:putative tricarboxylic transport membrane protein
MIGGPAGERRPDRAAFAVAAVLAAIAAMLIWESRRVPNKAGYAGVGAADILWLLGLCLAALAAATAVAALRGGFIQIAPQRVAPPLWIGGGLLAQLFLLGTAGFTIATGLLFAATAAAFGERRYHLSVPFGLLLAFGVYGVFDRLLKLNLPAGLPERLVFGG